MIKKETRGHSDYQINILEIARRKNFDENYVRNILDLRRNIFNNIGNNQELFNEFFKRLNQLTEMLGPEECQKYLAWHIAVGSTPDENLIQFLDFEGEDNIQNLLKSFP
ncbi:hypothetical protein HRbin35_00217 [bacterium HR35]|nr:hypothetical protein HRbin35_00217 [bacterium HR35]